jgi:hypothetical protein
MGKSFFVHDIVRIKIQFEYVNKYVDVFAFSLCCAMAESVLSYNYELFYITKKEIRINGNCR